MRCVTVVGVLGLALFLSSQCGSPAVGADDAAGPSVSWIWFNEGNPQQDAPNEPRYFRKVFNINRPVAKPVDEGTLDITADNAFVAYVNGVEVGKGDDWKRVYRFDVMKHLVHGKNVLAVKATNQGGPAGLMAKLGYIPNGMSKMGFGSDGTWKSSKTAAAGWEKVNFKETGWQPVKVLDGYGSSPWQGQVWDAGGDDRFSVPPGFKVELVIPANAKTTGLDPKLPFSLVNLCFDAKGRLLVAQERGPILLCTDPHTKPEVKGVLQNIRPYCTSVKGCHGMAWVDDALLLVGDGPQGTGLYRVRDTDGDDKTDKVELLHRFKGGMGEHGPHAIMEGPDGWLYLVIGNHAWAQPDKLAANSPLTRWPKGQMGPDQGQPGTTEDVLLKRLNDARGHAADILAPGGTIWRMDKNGKNMSVVNAGFRNHFDAAFNAEGELFTFDSDMEWDEGLPWYRAVRAAHCPPGADFLWRTGAANTPDYYIDSLPPLAETGRGSPVGVTFYNHVMFPKKYNGSFLMADWAIGVIYVVFLEQDGASYKGKLERFCTGNPMNVTDLAVRPGDGAVYFTLGGRATQGGVYRIVYTGKDSFFNEVTGTTEGAASEHFKTVVDLVNQRKITPWSVKDLSKSIQVPSPDFRRGAAWMLGVQGEKGGKVTVDVMTPLLNALKDKDALVRRRTCEALIRAGIQPPVEDLWPLLGDKDRFVRTAARLVLQRIAPIDWTERLWKETDDQTAFQGIIALCKTNQADPFAARIFRRLLRAEPGSDPQKQLDVLRTLELALVHTQARPKAVRELAERCSSMFPNPDKRVDRELAILLTYFSKENLLDGPIQTRLLHALLEAKGDRQQQIHLFYCLRFLHKGWTPNEKAALLEWYESTKGWIGGHSFALFLEHILRDLNPVFTPADRDRVLARGTELPTAASALLRLATPQQLPSPKVMADLYARLLTEQVPQGLELRAALIEGLGKCPSAEAPAALRKIGDKDPGQRDAVARGLSRYPAPENWSYLVRGLESSNAVLVFEVIDALKKIQVRPKSEDPAPYRALLVAAGRLDPRNRWKVVELLRHWSNGRQFGAEEGQWKDELASWSRWFSQAFPKEAPVAGTAEQAAESKYKFPELLAYLEKDPAGKKGDPARGRAVFEKAQCFKCHKFGKEGEGIGPDLTTLSKRFKRVDTLDSLFYPSKVISDQYRSTQLETKNGQRLNGLAAPQGDTVTLLLNDGSKVNLKKNDIEQQFASLISVMPEKLLDPLTKEEIADLFAFLETEPK